MRSASIPNPITFFRLISCAVLVALFATGSYKALLITYALMELLDQVDGKLAKAMKWQTKVGQFFDPFADSMTHLIAFACDAGLNYLSVYPDGRFGICKDIYTSARITDDDFVKKYRSREFQEEMKRLREGCEGCNWSCYITASKIAHMMRKPNKADIAMLRSY